MLQDWDDLRFFLAVARAGSLAGAARALSVNHSTVYRRINNFEAELGVRLFDRLPEGYALTAAGAEAARHAEDAGAATIALEMAVAGRDIALSGTVRLTTAGNLAHSFLPDYLRSFREVHPEIRVEVIVSGESRDLSRREADIALRATSSTPPDYLVGRKVVDIPWYVYAGDRYVQQYGAPKNMGELSAHSLIGGDDSFSRLPALAWLKENVEDTNIVLRSNDLNAMAGAVIAGLGLALLPGDQIKPGLVRLFPMDPSFVSQIWLLTHPDLRNVPRIKALMRYIYECMHTDPRLSGL